MNRAYELTSNPSTMVSLKTMQENHPGLALIAISLAWLLCPPSSLTGQRNVVLVRLD